MSSREGITSLKKIYSDYNLNKNHKVTDARSNRLRNFPTRYFVSFVTMSIFPITKLNALMVSVGIKKTIYLDYVPPIFETKRSKYCIF